jgi:hypothetical protein
LSGISSPQLQTLFHQTWHLVREVVFQAVSSRPLCKTACHHRHHHPFSCPYRRRPKPPFPSRFAGQAQPPGRSIASLVFGPTGDLAIILTMKWREFIAIMLRSLGRLRHFCCGLRANRAVNAFLASRPRPIEDQPPTGSRPSSNYGPFPRKFHALCPTWRSSPNPGTRVRFLDIPSLTPRHSPPDQTYPLLTRKHS